MKTREAIFLGLLAFSFLPVWRGYGDSRVQGHNLWEHLSFMITGPGYDWDLVPYDEALQQAREAYHAIHG